MLIVEKIKAGYYDSEILKGISFSVKKGNIVTLLGANGAGKTTTLRVISGLLKPKEGEIRFNGMRINGLPPNKILKMGISQVLEGRELFPEMSVYENLRVGGITLSNKNRFHKNLDRVYVYFPIMSERKTQLAVTLSGGEQQMLAIGRAMMSDPKMLLLDEPTAGLAPLIVRNIYEIVARINREEGVSILLVEQNVNIGLRVSNYSYVMENGNISLSGHGDELINSLHIKKSYLGG